MSIRIPSAINVHVDGAAGDRYSLVDGIMRNGIMTALERHLYLTNKVTRATIRKGQMFEEWTRYGRIGSEYHDLGTEALPQDLKVKKYRIFLDERPLITSHAVDDWEDFVSNVPHQVQYATAMGDELGFQREIETIKQIILAGRDAGDITEDENFRGSGVNGTGAPYSIGSSATAAAYLAALDSIDENWFEIGSRGTEAWCLVPTDKWYELRDAEGVFAVGTDGSGNLNSAFYNPTGGFMAGPSPQMAAGPDAELEYKGIRIVRSNVASNVFGQDLSGDRYRSGDFGARASMTVDTGIGTTASQTPSATVGAVWKPDAVAMVDASSPKFESERRAGFQQTNMYGTQLLGGGSLYAENAIELVTGS